MTATQSQQWFKVRMRHVHGEGYQDDKYRISIYRYNLWPTYFAQRLVLYIIIALAISFGLFRNPGLIIAIAVAAVAYVPWSYAYRRLISPNRRGRIWNGEARVSDMFYLRIKRSNYYRVLNLPITDVSSVNEKEKEFVINKSYHIKSENLDELALLRNLADARKNLQTAPAEVATGSVASRECLPVIYQLEQDITLGNGLERVYCKTHVDRLYSQRMDGLDVNEVTLVYRDEESRKFAIVDDIYRLFRLVVGGRVHDVETFFIAVNKSADRIECVSFPPLVRNTGLSTKTIAGTYSGPKSIADGPEHKVASVCPKYFFNGEPMHPAIFVNTENHAMSEADNNPGFWKREFLGWSDRLKRDSNAEQSSRTHAEKEIAKKDVEILCTEVKICQ